MKAISTSRPAARGASILAAFTTLLFSAGMSMAGTLAEGPAINLPAGEAAEEAARFSEADADGRFVYLVRFAEPGMLERFRQVRTAGEAFDPASSVARAAAADIQGQQRAHLQSMRSAVGRAFEVSHHYLATHSGIAARLTPAEAAEVQKLPGVVEVERERVYQLDTYRGPEFIGAASLWNGTASPDGLQKVGTGMIAAVLDTGVDANNPAFANDPSCGHGAGGVPAKLLSALDCASTDGSGMCNGPSAADDNSHGSHTASTVAGNSIDETAVPPPTLPGAFTQMSGVAPCASLRTYKTCSGTGCGGAAIQAGLNSVLLHGDVDVVNFSISGGASPWNDNDRRKLDLVDAGIFVAASAGNTSATITNPVGQVNHRGPWVMSVAATTRDVDAAGNPAQGDVLADFSFRGPTPAPLADLQKPDITAPGVNIYAAAVGYSLKVSGPPPVPANLLSIAMDQGSQSPVGAPLSNFPIAFDPSQTISPPGSTNGTDGCAPFAANLFAGKVALIQRGGCSFFEKINNAANAGAAMVVIWNNQPGGISMDTTGQNPATPAFSILEADGIALRNFIGSNPTATVDYAAALDTQYGFISGTSMSSPHVAGAAVLVREAQPDWTAPEVKSAMQMTASKAGFQENGTTPWNWDDVGSGRVDLARAALAGFVMDETFANFLAANPASGGNVKTLNLPALRNLNCSPSCSFTRTVRNTLDTASSWSTASSFTTGNFTVAVSPSSFSFTGGLAETQTLTITVTPVGNQASAIHFGELVFTEASALSPPLHWTLAFSGSQLNDPSAQISPAAFDLLIEENGSASRTLYISNTAADAAALTFQIDEAQPSSVVVLGSKPDGDEQISGGGAAEPISLILDDGIATLIGVGTQQFLWFNQFTPGLLDLPFTLEQVRVGFAPGNGGVVAGHLFDVHVWVDEDRNPRNGATLVASVTNQVITAGVNFKVVDLPAGVPIDASSGDVLIGVVNRSAAGTTYSPAVADVPGNSQGRSWAAFNFPGGNAPNPPVFSGATTFGLIEELGLPGRNWTIRGFGTGGSACLAPSDVPWLTVTPTSGSVASGTTTEVTLDFDMTGLAAGAYEARVCVETNDPAQPVTVVPVSVEVVAAADLPVINVAQAAFDFTVEQGQTDADVLTIGNAGTGLALDWSIDTVDLTGGGDIVRFDNVNFVPQANGTGGGVQWHTGNTCQCDTSPFNLNIYTSSGNIAFFWPSITGATTRGAVATSATGGAYRVLQPGDSIGPGSTFATSGDTTNWRNAAGVHGYLGFRFQIPGDPTVLYGYAEVQTTGTSGNPVTVIGWAYNSAGDPITIPEPPSACVNPNTVPWLDANPGSGSTAAGDISSVDIAVDAAGLVPGQYEALLCVTSNDPVTPLVEVPVSLTVEATPPPVINVSTAPIDFALAPEQADSVQFGIANDGVLALEWSIGEAAPLRAGYRQNLSGGGAIRSPQGDRRESGSVATGTVSRSAAPAPQGGPIDTDFSESFDDITTLTAAGWATQNNSAPLGGTGWFQGNTGVFSAHEGADNSYIGANFNNVSGNNTISNWLLTPHVVLENGTELRFWTRVPTGSAFADRLQVRLSTAGASSNVGTAAEDLGDFTTLMLDINPSLVVGGYPEVWTEYVATVSGLPAPTSGRFAFRYYVTSGGPAGANSSYIGIDSVSVTQPEACDFPSDLPWLSATPASGTTGAGGQSDVTVAADATGLAPGLYEGVLCINSNDPVTPRVSVPVSLAVAQLAQTIDFPAIADQLLTDSPVTVSATADSGLVVGFGSLTAAVCSVAGNQVTLLASGTCTIEATQPGNATYEAAAPVQQSFQVTDPTVTVQPGSLPPALIDAPYVISFTASGAGASEPFTFTFTGELPDGMVLDVDGLLSGTPTETGTFEFTVTATDSTSAGNGGPFVGSRSYTLEVLETFIFFDGFEPLVP